MFSSVYKVSLLALCVCTGQQALSDCGSLHEEVRGRHVQPVEGQDGRDSASTAQEDSSLKASAHPGPRFHCTDSHAWRLSQYLSSCRLLPYSTTWSATTDYYIRIITTQLCNIICDHVRVYTCMCEFGYLNVRGEFVEHGLAVFI